MKMVSKRNKNGRVRTCNEQASASGKPTSADTPGAGTLASAREIKAVRTETRSKHGVSSGISFVSHPNLARIEHLKAPAELILSGNVVENWRRFKQLLELFLTETEPAGERTALQKIALLLHVAGDDAQEVFNTFEETEGASYKTVISKFEVYCIPKKNETCERYVIRMRVHDEGEPFEQFLRHLQLKVKSCQLSQLADFLLRDQIAYGIGDRKLWQRLLREQDLSLAQPVTICRADELARKQDAVSGDESTLDAYATGRHLSSCF